jgi:hypothetical protein
MHLPRRSVGSKMRQMPEVSKRMLRGSTNSDIRAIEAYSQSRNVAYQSSIDRLPPTDDLQCQEGIGGNFREFSGRLLLLRFWNGRYPNRPHHAAVSEGSLRVLERSAKTLSRSSILTPALSHGERAPESHQQVTSLPSLPKIARRCSGAICAAPAGL